MLPLRDCWQVPPGDLGPLGSNVGERERESAEATTRTRDVRSSSNQSSFIFEVPIADKINNFYER